MYPTTQTKIFSGRDWIMEALRREEASLPSPYERKLAPDTTPYQKRKGLLDYLKMLIA